MGNQQGVQKHVFDPETDHIILPQLAEGTAAALTATETDDDALTSDAPRQHGLRLVLISDTHGMHRKLGKIPDGDVLVHAGDFTRFGKLEDAIDFNAWLGEQPHAHKVVVFGNHECNADWAREARAKASSRRVGQERHDGESGSGGRDAGNGSSKTLAPPAAGSARTAGTSTLLSNAVLLAGDEVTLPPGAGAGAAGKYTGLRIHGTDFFWPMREGENNPDFGLIPEGCDVVIAHGPARGYVDGGHGGCESLSKHIARARPRLVVSGHIHGSHGAVEHNGTLYVNAANARRGHADIGWRPIVVDL